jgi:multiple sugar transport system permease protein
MTRRSKMQTSFWTPGHLGAQLILFLSTIYFLLPLVWVTVAATKSNEDLFSTFGLWFGGHFALFSNIHRLFTYDGGIFSRWVLNTLLYAGVGAAGATLFSTMAGYALAKYRFFGSTAVSAAVIGAVLVPVTALALPLFFLASRVHLVNTYWSVLLPSMVSPLGVYLARVYAQASVPDEMLEAARIDGSSELAIFFRISLRIMSPVVVTIFLFQFVAIWNNFFLPLVMLSDDARFPLTLGLQTWNTTLATSGHVIYDLVVTGSFLSIMPLIAAFLFLQRYWRSGIASGGVVG